MYETENPSKSLKIDDLCKKMIKQTIKTDIFEIYSHMRRWTNKQAINTQFTHFP